MGSLTVCVTLAPFIRWLADEREYTIDDIVGVLEKPYHFTEEYQEFLERGPG